VPARSTDSYRVTIHPRLHLTLIGMNKEGYRRNGGAGFCIRTPNADVTVARASSFRLIDKRAHPLAPNEQKRLAKVASRLTENPVCITITGQMPSHFGFGSATGIRLAVIEAISLLEGKGFSRKELVRRSGRGGTSGIGVTSYFEGGLIVDLGVRSEGGELLPSSSLEGQHPEPLLLSRVEMPTWKIGLCIPHDTPTLSEEQEIDFFRRASRMSRPAVNETLYHVIYGLLAGSMEGDFETFCRAINSIQDCAWKRMEWKLHGKRLRIIEKSIYKAGADVVGLSSIGPGLYFFGKDVVGSIAKLRRQYPKVHWKVSSLCNSSRTLNVL